MNDFMFYSRSTRGFYSRDIHGFDIPQDAVEISYEHYTALLSGQSAGQIIECNESGLPYLVERPPLSVEQLTQIATAERLKAYREEADPLFFKMQRGEVTMDEWLAKIAEIKERYPKPTTE